MQEVFSEQQWTAMMWPLHTPLQQSPLHDQKDFLKRKKQAESLRHERFEVPCVIHANSDAKVVNDFRQLSLKKESNNA